MPTPLLRCHRRQHSAIAKLPPPPPSWPPPLPCHHASLRSLPPPSLSLPVSSMPQRQGVAAARWWRLLPRPCPPALRCQRAARLCRWQRQILGSAAAGCRASHHGAAADNPTLPPRCRSQASKLATTLPPRCRRHRCCCAIPATALSLPPCCRCLPLSPCFCAVTVAAALPPLLPRRHRRHRAAAAALLPRCHHRRCCRR